MTDVDLTKGTPQFDTAEYAGSPGGDRCKVCNQPVGATYYRMNGAMACSLCAEKAKDERPADSHAAFMRGLLFGIGGAIVGLILYAAFAIITGLVIGYVSLAVGYIVGKAIKAGSKGRGGRRYQITALVLTYAAVSMAAVPIGISQAIKQMGPRKQAQTQPVTSSRSPSDQQEQPSSAPTSFGGALLTLIGVGLASPFLELQDPVHGLIGLVILAVGLRIAWKLTAGSDATDIIGPFSNPTPAANTG